MKLELRNLPIGTRIALALALPLAGLIVLTAWMGVDRHRTARNLESLHTLAELAPAISALVHELQMERGISAGLIGGQQASNTAGSVHDFTQRLPQHYAATDRAHVALELALKRHEQVHAEARHQDDLLSHITVVAEARNKLENLATIRSAVSSRRIDAPTVASHYMEIISELIGITEEMQFTSTQPELTRAIATYLHLLHAKEQTGLERALGSAGFAAGRFDPATHARLIERIEQQRFHLARFRAFATPEQVEFLEQTLYGPNEAEVSRMRRIALKSRDTGSTGGVSAVHWYDSMTQKINQLKIIEERLAHDLIARAQAIRLAANEAAGRITLLAVLLLALTIALASALARGIILPLKKMTAEMEKLAAGDEHIEIIGTEHGDEIGALARAARIFRENLAKVAQAEEQMKVAQELRIAATAFESLHGMMVTDARGIILRVNKAFVEMTGWSAEEAIGQKPALLKSGRHDAAFYADMWRQLAASGAWSGEIWDRRKNGEIYPKWQTISAVRGMDGQITHYVAAFSDISERKEAEQRIHDLAYYDPLTRLPNRRLLLDRLQQALSLSARNGHYGALLFIDLDNFKSLNDTLGHDMGDLLLIQVAERLQTCLRGSDTAARLGGDEFVIMLEDLSDQLQVAATDAETVGTKILDALNRAYHLAGKEHHSTPSIGITLYRGNEAGIDELLKQADLAMYQAKAAGRNAMRFYDPEMQTALTLRSALESDLRRALQADQFVLYYQPQVDDAGHLVGAEALVRWNHPERGLVSPADFIPLAEETGLILPLGQWVLNIACTRLAAWQKHPATAELTLAINVSARQFRQANFVGQVMDALERSGANPKYLKIELTESLLLDDIENTIATMEALRTRGVRFSLDDFGTGYSSLAYLKRLPLDQLKIDRSFVRDVLTDPNDAIIARTIITLAHSLDLNVIAEGVENEAQREFLIANNCHTFQGYLFGRPEPEMPRDSAQ
jgi:diguanylate cyclase (GGDEF)-like protein/PAS domain S-box-containing protein